MMPRLTVWIVVVCGLAALSRARVQQADLKQTVGDLFHLLEDLQVKHDRPFIPSLMWQLEKGFYPTDMRFNFVGPSFVSELRELVAIDETISFYGTAMTTETLLEAHHYAKAPLASDQQILMTLDALTAFTDHNLNYASSLVAVDHQEYDTNSFTWLNRAFNLKTIAELLTKENVDQFEKLLLSLGWNNTDYFVLSALRNNGTHRFYLIPEDFDDTCVNLGLGALLVDMGQDLPRPLARWKEQNTNLSSVLDAMRRYAYRPFSADDSINTLDTRNYFFVRRFLDLAWEKGQDVALIPTWAQSVTEARQNFFDGRVMPFQVNNVDLTISATVVYGLTAAVLSELLPTSVLDSTEDPQISQVYHNTTAYLVFMVNNDMFERPDLAMTYYMSVFQMYWYLSRTFHRMEIAMQTRPLPDLMQELYPMIKAALEGAVTSRILSTRTEEGEDMKYYDDFLGNADLDDNNQTLMNHVYRTIKLGDDGDVRVTPPVFQNQTKGEDRLFTTAMAINALLNTWTLDNPTAKTMTWKTGTPDEVKDTVDKCITWLSRNILGIKYKPWNVMYTTSWKGDTAIPQLYPGNRLELLNGTRVQDYTSFPSDAFVYGVEGYIPKEQYEAMVENKSMHFGTTTPTEFISYNRPLNLVVFFNTPACTYAVSMLALSRYDTLITN